LIHAKQFRVGAPDVRVGVDSSNNWHLAADSQSRILTAQFKILYHSHPRNLAIGLKSFAAKNFNVQACPRDRKNVYQKNEVRLVNRAFRLGEWWDLESDGAGNYYFKNRATKGYLAIAPEETHTEPIYLYKDVEEKKSAVPTRTGQMAGRQLAARQRAARIKNKLDANKMTVYKQFTAWTSITRKKSRSLAAFEEGTSTALALKNVNINLPDKNPLQIKVKNAQFSIEPDPEYNVSLKDIENISNKKIAIQEKRTKKYFRVKRIKVGRGFQYRFVPDAENTSDPATHFKFIYKNPVGEYWLALVSLAPKSKNRTLQNDPKRYYAWFPNGHFNNWASWEISGSLEDGIVLRHMVGTDRFLHETGDVTDTRARAGKFLIKILS
jgi:hypothetical protein